MNTKNIPPLIMLTAGLIVTAVMYIKHYQLHIMLGILLAVLLAFYIIGLLIQKMFDAFGKEIKKREAEEKEKAEKAAKDEKDAQQGKTLFDENQDGAVIEKQ